ncbi:MAG TPA: UDP-N-acetylmuramoyl-L-alanyl-D-glutamate--2,6-diaminopimelate ligase [Gemmatimonadaceae bacterium]|nr:UDP-N-acetylmuramoyl-L-alanyl-D-glutamate--2,6-diaminopimelate ligase [Gemmatimonadaceae bacterium]
MRFALADLAAALEAAGLLAERRGELPEAATELTDDSRAVRPGAVFIAVRGTTRDGHEFLPAARAAGAVAPIVEDPARCPPELLPSLVVRDGRRAAALAAAVVFGRPADRLQLVGVTGTNGKTTTVHILRHLLDTPKARSASIGTLGALLGSEGRPLEGGGGLTTPGPVELQRLFRAMVDAGIGRVAMEVSSHSLDQLRIEGVAFDVAVYTNLTRDHLDYHGTMDAYFRAKARLLEHLRPHGTVVYNLDCKEWSHLHTDRRRLAFSERVITAEVHAEDVRFGPRGSSWRLALAAERVPVELPLIGDFNVANALGAAAAAYALGTPAERIAERLATVPQVPGRLELLHDQPAVLRDYAHTPDALERAMDAVRPFARARLIVVFGCGGDRDAGKRPLMGAIAARKADLAIVTSDNPRTEDPERILDDIEAGMRGMAHERIVDRHEAIERALDLAAADDVVLLAGKGHETYQVRGTTKFPFDEQAIVRELTRARRVER